MVVPMIVMSSKHHGGDINYAYPTAEIAVMGPEGAVNIIFRKEIDTSEDPEATRQKLIEEYRNNFASPFKAAELGYIDHIIFPENTRPRLINALMMLKDKKDSIPERAAREYPSVDIISNLKDPIFPVLRPKKTGRGCALLKREDECLTSVVCGGLS